jgi:hypothetical protein
MLVKLAANKTVSVTATALQTAVQFHNKNCWSVKTRSKHRRAWAISVDGRAKKNDRRLQ